MTCIRASDLDLHSAMNTKLAGTMKISEEGRNEDVTLRFGEAEVDDFLTVAKDVDEAVEKLTVCF